MTTRSQGSKVGNADSDLEARVRALEQKLAMMSARPVVPTAQSVKVRISKVAHGLTVGTWVRLGGDPIQWVSALARVNDPVGGQVIARLTGVVTRIFGADQFEVTISGMVEGINNPEDEEAGEFLVGLVYSLSEITPGAITKDLTTTRIECFQATGLHSGVVIQSVNCQADLFVTAGGIAGGKVVNNLSELADAASDTNRAFLGVTINDYTEADSGVACRSGIVAFPDTVEIPIGGIMWLDPTSPGDLTGTKPTTPADQKPIPIMLSIGNNVYWVNPPGMSDLGISDLWDVDHSTPPADGEVLKWDDTDKRYKPGEAGLATEADGPSVIARIETGVGPVVAFQVTVPWGVLVDGGAGDLEWKLLTPDHLEDFPAYSVLANVTGSADVADYAEAPDGTLFGRVGSTMGFGSDPELGTAAAGGGYFKIHFAAGKYFEIAADGSLTIYHSASLSLVINASGKLTLTYGSSNTVTIDPADIVGSSRALKIRELDICDAFGVAKKIQVLSTAAY